jgi:hypothetical protein
MRSHKGAAKIDLVKLGVDSDFVEIYTNAAGAELIASALEIINPDNFRQEARARRMALQIQHVTGD